MENSTPRGKKIFRDTKHILYFLENSIINLLIYYLIHVIFQNNVYFNIDFGFAKIIKQIDKE